MNCSRLSVACGIPVLLPALLPALGLAVLAPLTACSTHDRAGTLRMESLGAHRMTLERGFANGAYAELESEHSFWFSDVGLEQLAAGTEDHPVAEAIILHAQLVWLPEPGRTPLADTATNAVTRVVVVSGGEVGLYGGAAFARPKGELGSDEVEISLRGGTMKLLAKTEGFHDLLGPVGLSGTFTAKLAPADAALWRRGVSQFVTNALGRSMWVQAAPGTDPRAEPLAEHRALAAH